MSILLPPYYIGSLGNIMCYPQSIRLMTKVPEAQLVVVVMVVHCSSHKKTKRNQLMMNLRVTTLNYARYCTCRLWPIKAIVFCVSSETAPEVTTWHWTCIKLWVYQQWSHHCGPTNGDKTFYLSSKFIVY